MTQIKAEAGTVEDALLTAATDFLQARGWQVAVVGGTIIRGATDDRKDRYELAVVFVGRKPKAKPTKGPA